jgi:surfactin synthase thioesterase subunit
MGSPKDRNTITSLKPSITAQARLHYVNVSTPWIEYYKPNPQARLRLFCFPYAGGGAAVFRGWVDRMPGIVEVCPVQLPGRETRMKEAPFNRLSTLVPAAAQALLPYLDKPFAFFGHSMGALVSFEIARVATTA